MGLAACITQLETWSVTGVTTNVAYDAFDGRLPDSKMPALVIELLGTGGEGFASHALGGSARMVVHVNHYLVMSGLGRGSYGVSRNDAIALFDNYLAKIKADPYLNNNLLEPMLVELSSTAPIVLAGKNFSGLTFRHRWVIAF